VCLSEREQVNDYNKKCECKPKYRNYGKGDNPLCGEPCAFAKMELPGVANLGSGCQCVDDTTDNPMIFELKTFR
jgi:hypothetical protein